MCVNDVHIMYDLFMCIWEYTYESDVCCVLCVCGMCMTVLCDIYGMYDVCYMIYMVCMCVCVVYMYEWCRRKYRHDLVPRSHHVPKVQTLNYEKV